MTWTRWKPRSSSGRAPTCSPATASPGSSTRAGRTGDLGADVIAGDHLGRKVVVQCKHYGKPAGSRDIQTFNDTARPEHHTDVPVMIGLNGFTRDARAFAARHDLVLRPRQPADPLRLGPGHPALRRYRRRSEPRRRLSTRRRPVGGDTRPRPGPLKPLKPRLSTSSRARDDPVRQHRAVALGDAVAVAERSSGTGSTPPGTTSSSSLDPTSRWITV
ncbi:restriction endonuclease [Kitasatospora purpeofusca]|uniref:restriction endonuclease n=1 Tax=Kitasatospora purpeofusca TaxID=67352 RepID=UPI0039B958E0